MPKGIHLPLLSYVLIISHNHLIVKGFLCFFTKNHTQYVKVRGTHMEKINISGSGLALLICIGIGIATGREDFALWLWFLTAIILHEVGHLIMAYGCHTPIRSIKLDLLGAEIALGGMVSYKQEFLIAMGGPLANVLTVVVLYICHTGDINISNAEILLSASVVLAVFNLLPIESMDGGRMLSIFLSHLLSPTVAHVTLQITTGIFLFCLWLISGYALLMGGGMVSLFVFSLYMLARILGR